MMHEFKAAETELFGEFQVSDLGLQKWHRLGNIGSALKDVKSLELFCTGRFGNAYCSFKQPNQKASRWRAAAFETPST